MKPRLLLMVIAASALVIAGAAVIILSANRPPKTPVDYSNNFPDLPSCPNSVTMLFKTDEAMLQAAPRLERDTRFYDVFRETKAQNYERLKRTLADQPELVALTKVETVPASVMFSMSRAGGRSTVLAELKSTYAPFDIQDPCESQTATATAATPTW